jgi:hypothetical protein
MFYGNNKMCMKQNMLTITLQKSAKDVYEFYINPKNTPKWLPFITDEETDTWPITVGTIYRNHNKEGKWTEYIVTHLIEHTLFELKTKDGNYHVRYSHTPIDEKSSILEYFEWVDNGELEDPFTKEVLHNLKKLLEK